MFLYYIKTYKKFLIKILKQTLLNDFEIFMFTQIFRRLLKMGEKNMKQLELDKTYEVEINVEINEKMFETEVYAYIIENLIRNANEKILCKIYDRKGIKKFTVDFDGLQLDKSSRFIVFDRPSKLFGSNVIHF